MRIYAGLMDVLNTSFDFSSSRVNSYAWGGELSDVINDSKNSNRFLEIYKSEAKSLVEDYFNKNYLKLAKSYGVPFLKVNVLEFTYSLDIADTSDVSLCLDYVSFDVLSNSGNFVFDASQKLMKNGKPSVYKGVKLDTKSLVKMIPEAREYL